MIKEEKTLELIQEGENIETNNTTLEILLNIAQRDTINAYQKEIEKYGEDVKDVVIDISTTYMQKVFNLILNHKEFEEKLNKYSKEWNIQIQAVARNDKEIEKLKKILN